MVKTRMSDVNGDNKVDYVDLKAIADHIMGTTSGVFNKKAADVNNDQKVNVVDIVILNFMLGNQ